MAKEKPKGIPIAEEELQAIFSGPAVLSNKVYASIVAAGVRITFMEQTSETATSIYRTAAVLSIQDALALRDLLSRHLGEIEKNLNEAIGTAEQEATK